MVWIAKTTGVILMPFAVPRTPRLLAAILSGMLAVSLAFAPSAPAATAAAPAGEPRLKRPVGVAHTWAPLYMSGDHRYSRREAVALAKKYDVIVAIPSGIHRHTAAMRAANPRLNLLAYSNAVLAHEGQVRGLPESAFTHDTSGRRVKAPGFGTFLMNPRHSQWRARAIDQCRQRVSYGGFDGCLVDMLTLGIFARNFVTALPVNPSTGRVYTQAEYRGEMVGLAGDLRRRAPGLVQIGNMVENSYRYWRSSVSSRPLVASAPGAQMEDFLRGAGDRAEDWPSVAEWQRDVRVVTDMEAMGKSGLFTTKLWSGASADTAAQWQAYAMATFLMGAGGHSFFAFTRSRDRAGASGTNLRYRMPNLGAAYGSMWKQNSGAYVRRFAKGFAAVNPTGRWAKVNLPFQARRLGGGVVHDKLWLAPHSGEVLRSTAGASARRSARLKVRTVTKVLRVTAGRSATIPVRVRNLGTRAAKRGRIRISGRTIKNRRVHVRQLGAGKSARVRARVRVKAVRKGRGMVKVVYRAGGAHAKDRTPVRIRRR